MTKKVLIDTDPGIDDAMAILFALNSPELEVVGLSAIFGNVHTELATANALRLLEFAGKAHIPVAQGAARPLHLPLDGVADFVHGANGFGEVDLPAPVARAVEQSAAHFIVETVMSHPGEITLVPLGPLTNLALALALEPRIAHQVAGVVLMGGAATVNGNVNPAAEANIINDPHAADRVFTAGWPVTMVGLDVTMATVMDQDYIASLATSRTGALINDICRFYLDFHHRLHGAYAAHTHDPSAIAYLIAPELFTVEYGPVRVITEGLALGQTLWDRRGAWYAPNAWSLSPPAGVCVGVDSTALLRLYAERIRGAQ
jgi:inosine-uridine nucleoside N-ribohydrolase